MLFRKKWHLLYAIFLLILSVGGTVATVNTNVYAYMANVVATIEEEVFVSILNTETLDFESNSKVEPPTRLSINAALPPTTILGADSEINCGVDGSLVAEVFICGDYDFKNLSLSGNSSGAIWEQYIATGSCAQDFSEVCPSFLVSGSNCSNNPTNWTQVATGGTYTINPSNVPVSSGTEFRVRIGGETYYIKATKSAFTYSSEFKNVVCGTLGSIRITGLSPAYELRIANGNGSFGAWQDSKEFTGLATGTYIVEVRLRNTPNACEYPYPPFTIEGRNIDIQVSVVDAACPGQNGDINVQVNGAEVPGPYSYTLIDATTNTELIKHLSLPDPFDSFPDQSPGTYLVKVETPECRDDFSSGISAPTQNQDVNGNPIVIGQGLQPIIAEANLNGQSFGCANISSIDIDITTTGGTPPYTYTVTSLSSGNGTSPSSYTNTSIYTVTSPDTYTFTFTDANGCSPASPLSVNIDNLPPPTINPEPVIGTCTNGGGKINFQVVDNPGYDLEFRVSSGDPWVNYNLVNVPDGTYNDMWVRYSQGAFSCDFKIADTLVVTSDSSISGSVSVTANYTCSAGGGTITFDSSATAGGTGNGYEYSIDNVTYQTGAVFSGLTPGTYTPFIRDDSDCRQSIGVPLVINEPPAPTEITFSQNNINCATGTSEVSVTVVGGVAVVSYEIVSPSAAVTAPQASNVFPNLLLDTKHDFLITDSNGCTHPASFVTGGVSTIKVRIKAGGDTNVCSGVNDGFGTFIIDGFNPDTPGADYNYTISGTTLSGSSSNLEIPVTGLGAGTYTITVTDNDTNCVDTADLVISESATLLVTSDVTPMSCINGNVGAVSANKTGGFSGQEQYQLTYPDLVTIVPWKNGRFFGGLNQTGIYTLEVRDSEGCIASTTFNLTSLGAPTISEGTINRCYTAFSVASIEVFSAVGSGSLNDHRFRILGQGLQPLGTPGTHTFTNLVPGTYTIEVENINTNCTATLAPITIEPELQVQLNLNSEIACGGDGAIDIIILGGDISDLTSTSYILKKDGVAIVGHNGVEVPSNPFTYTVPFGEHGDYTIELTDNNSCSDISDSLTMIEPANITATANSTGPSCGDPNSGYVELIPTVNPGVAPFQYAFGPVGSLTDVVTAPNYPDGNAGDGVVYTFSSQNIYSGLAAGNYEYIVIDNRGCPTLLQTVSVIANTDPPPTISLTPIDATCNPNGPVSGGITINSISPGSPNYVIQIEDNFGNIVYRQEDVTPGDLPLNINSPLLITGDYQVVVIDARGCTDIQSATIETGSLDIVPTYPLILTCTPSGYTVCVDILGGSSPEDYSIRLVENPSLPWENPNTDFNTHCFGGLLAGVSYIVEVRDDNTNCTYQEVITLPNGPNIAVTLDVDGATCRNGDVGVNYSIDAANAGTPPYEVTITNLTTATVVHHVLSTTDLTLSASLTVPAGRYSVGVEDAAFCSAGDESEAILNAPRVDIVSNQNANCNAPGLLTVRGSGGFLNPGSQYLFAFMDEGVAPTIADFSPTSTVSLSGSIAPGTPYDIWVRDDNLCSYRISATVIQEDPPLPAPTISVNNQCDVSTPVGGFEITIEMPGNIDTPTFTLEGVSQTPTYTPGVPTQAIFYVNSIGNYPVNVTDINGCFVDDSAEVYQVLSASADFATTPPNCTDADGEIMISANGGSGDFTFELSGIDYTGAPIANVSQTNNGTFIGISPGTYQVIVTDNQVTDGVNPCSVTITDIISEEPTVPQIIETGATNITCHDTNDGSITTILQPNANADAVSAFRLYDSANNVVETNTTGSFINLAADTYRVEVETVRHCIASETVVITNPEPFAIVVPTPIPTFQCSSGTNQVSTAVFTVQVDAANGNGGTPGDYRYRIDSTGSYATSSTFEVFDDGTTQTILVEAIDANGCTANVSFDIQPPSDISGQIFQDTAMSCIEGEVIDVQVTMTTAADYIIRANANSVAIFPDTPTIAAGTTNYSITLPQVEGDYYLEIVSGGCVYPMPVYTVVAPVNPVIIIEEVTPETCFSARNGTISIEISNYAGNGYSYWVYDANDPGFLNDDFTSSTPLIGASGSLNGLTVDIASDGNPATISDIPSGNIRIVVQENDAPNCRAYSNVITVRSPNPVGPLEVFNLTQDQTVGCTNDSGIISYDAQYGWDTDAFTFTIERENQASGEPRTGNWTSLVVNSLQQSLNNLAAGWYRVTVTDIFNCTGSQEIELLPEPVVEVALAIERELECPNGTNAILVAVDPNDMTAEGAIGGVPGEQFLYQLIKLNSNHSDPLNQDPSNSVNHEFETGQQTSPRFEGIGGTGVISAGFYSVLVEGPFGCRAYSPVIEVIPPKTINPQLRLVSAPACGTLGALELKVFNAEVDGTGNLLPNVAYEYRVWVDPLSGSNTNTWTTMTAQNGTAVENISGIVGNFYKYEVRKVGVFGTCLEQASNQIEVKDPSVLTIDHASSKSGPSCSSIEDGRIEIKASGGTGIYKYTLFLANANSPTIPTTVFRPEQDSPNFENLPPNFYVAVVTSGNPSVCREEFPFELAPAIAVSIEHSVQNIICNGNATGSITMTVDPSYNGLVEFSIEPNFADLDSDPSNPLVYTFTDLPVKTDGTPYRVLAQDAEGCPYFFEIPLTQPDELQIINLESTPELCIGANNGTVVFEADGGTPFNDSSVSTVPYFEYKIEMISPIDETGTGIFAPYTGQVIQNLVGGATYAVHIQDVNLCSTNDVFTIDIGVDMSATSLVEYGCESIFPNSTASVVLDDPTLLPDLLFYLEDLNATTSPLTLQEMINLAETKYSWGNLPTSEYRAHIFHQNGCAIYVDIGEILAYEPLTLSEPEKISPNEITITASGGYGDYEYFFQGDSQGTDNVYTSNVDGNIAIEVRDSKGCVVTASIPFDFTGKIIIPNFFTPDGDGNNDKWYPKNRDYFPDIKVEIYDRYGRVVAVLNQVTMWDGTYDGKELPSGDYWYVVNQNDARKTRYVGHFTLYR